MLRVSPPIDIRNDVGFVDSQFSDNTSWSSLAYPAAASQAGNDGREFKTAGLSGTLYAGGGGGQGPPDLDLSVDAPPEGDGWEGISGAPVFVDGRIAGLIKSNLTGFAARRLAAVPAQSLLKDPLFRLAITPSVFELPRGTLPTVVLHPGSKEEPLINTVRAAMTLGASEEKSVFGLEPGLAAVSLDDAFRSPEQFLTLVQRICQAPVLIVDITDFTPGSMLMLGIRAVVRRGVTLLLTTSRIDETQLSQLPFNIQETKLISTYREKSCQPTDPLHPVRRIMKAIRDGLKQSRLHRRYLDLPVYDAVRCAEPEQKPDVSKSILVLCSFREEYSDYWAHLANQLFLQAANSPPVRLRDLASPRLVGQALYEAIRWTPRCIVDWTHWRPNVFFELGVRLACSNTGPVSLIEQKELVGLSHSDPGARSPPSDLERTAVPATSDRLAPQKAALLELLKPIVYRLGEDDLGGEDPAFKEAFAHFRAYESGVAPSREVYATSLAHNDVHAVATQSYDWSQDLAIEFPHLELSAVATELLGPDPQKTGRAPFLFSLNRDYAAAMRKSVAERWIAAWCYMSHRYTIDRLGTESERKLRDEAVKIGNRVLQELKDSSDADHRRIVSEIDRWLELLPK